MEKASYRVACPQLISVHELQMTWTEQTMDQATPTELLDA